jgi:hypothetical protein
MRVGKDSRCALPRFFGTLRGLLLRSETSNGISLCLRMVRHSENDWCGAALPGLIFSCLLLAIQHHPVESMEQGLAARVRTGSIDAGLDSCLRKL